MQIFRTNWGKELGINFTKSSKEEKQGNSVYYSYFFILFKAITKYAIRRYKRYLKDFWHWEKMSRELKRLQQPSFQKPKRKCSRVFFMKIETNNHVNEVGVVFFTQDFSNRKIYFVSLIFNQIQNNFHFQEVFSQNSFKTFIEKINRLKGQLGKCKNYGGACSQQVPWKYNPLKDILFTFFWKKS